MKNFDNIIFDFGGVIINIDTYKTIKEFASLAGKDPNILLKESLESPVFNDFEKGLVDESAFIEGVKDLIGGTVSDQNIIDCWNAMIMDIPKERIELLKRLSNEKDIYLLSNTNSIHLDRVAVEVRKAMGQDFIDPLFKNAYYSHLIGMRKPDAEIYEFVLRENDLDPSKTLFLDDNLDNLKGAEKVGISTLLVSEENGILDIF